MGFSGTIAHATGRVYAEAGQQLVFLLILGGCAFYGIRYGIEGVAWAVIIALVWLFIAQSYLSIKIIEAGWKDFFKSLIPAIANMMIMIFINIVLVMLIENYWGGTVRYEIKLLITVIINVIIFLSLIIFMPYSIKGDTFEWILERYRRFVPGIFIRMYYRFNK